MESNQRKLQKNWIYITLVMVIGFIIVTISVAYTGFQSAEEATEAFARFYLEENKARIKKEVEARRMAIENEYNTVEAFYRDAIEHEIHHLAALLKAHSIKDIEDPIQRRDAAIIEFERMIEGETDYLFFAIDSKGYLLRSGTDERVEGKDFTGIKDIDGIDMAGEVLKALDVEEGVFVEYSWPKVKDGKQVKKTSFCYYLEDYDIIIATGIYHDDILAMAKERMIVRLQNYNVDKEEYFFVTSYEDAVAKVAATPSGIGADYSAYKDYDGNPLHELFIAAAKTEGGDFVTYRYYEADSDQLNEKISYVMGIESWDAYIGLGFYNDDLKAVIDSYEADYKSMHYREIAFIGLALLLVAVMVLLYIRRGARLMRIHLEHEEGMFTQLIQFVTEGVIIVDENDAIRYANQQAHRYLGDGLYDYLAGGQKRVKILEKNTYKAVNGDRTYYVEINEDYINYHNVPCKIYLIKNITSQYLKSNALEQLSYIDELTELPNRRALANDYEALRGSGQDYRQCVIGMIDLDYFKVINDSRGHEFGDEILKLLADVFNKRLRYSDKLYRYGGEEFIVLMKGTNLKSAKLLMEEINKAFSERVKFIHDVESSFSGGLVNICQEDGLMKLKDVINEADKKMYQAKGEGRNRVVI